MGVRVVFPDMGKDPSVQLIEKTITENGTYDALTDGANGYSKVNVNVEGGGGSSDFSTAQVTVKMTGKLSAATIDVQLKNPLTEDANGIMVVEEDNIRYLTADTQVIELQKPSLVEETKTIYLYENNPIFVEWGLAQSTSDYTITGSGEAVTLDLDGTLIYAVKVTGDCTITIS